MFRKMFRISFDSLKKSGTSNTANGKHYYRALLRVCSFP